MRLPREDGRGGLGINRGKRREEELPAAVAVAGRGGLRGYFWGRPRRGGREDVGGRIRFFHGDGASEQTSRRRVSSSFLAVFILAR